METSEAVEALSIVLILIALTILFEKFKHGVEHAAGRALRPIVKALFGELTVLGFLSTITFCLQKMGAFVALSKMISSSRHGHGGGKEEEGEGNEEDDEIFELVEIIHFGMFGVMVIFLISVIIEVVDGLHVQKEWCQWDRACHDDAYVQTLLKNNAILDDEYDAITSMHGMQGIVKRMGRFLLPYLRFLPFLRDTRKEILEDKMEFCSLRLEFFRERDVQPPYLPAGEDVEGAPQKTVGSHFNFGRYLTYAYARKMAAVVDIDTTTWLIFAIGVICYFILFDVLDFSVKALAWSWVLIGWTFHVLSVNFEQYLIGIRDRFLAPEFIPQPRLRELSWGSLTDLDEGSNSSEDIVGTEKEPLRPVENRREYQGKTTPERLPMWCHIDLDVLDRNRSRLAKYFFGPTPQNRQHALYLCGHDGPAFHTLCLRIILLFSCVYSAQLGILFLPALARDKSTSTFEFIAYCILALIPALAFIFNRKRTITIAIQVGSIGSFVLPHAVAESEREEKTSMAVRILVLVFKLAKMTKCYVENPADFKSDSISQHYSEVLSLEDIAELTRIFRNHLDHDGDGLISSTEYQSLMSTVGINMTEEEASGLIRSMFKQSESDKVEITKDAFFKWYASQLGSSEDDKKECAEFLFSLFDEDGSGDITVLEFKQQLDKLRFGITHEEADELLEELDEDGNGVLCSEEFHDMIDHFYPLEFDKLAS